MIEYAIMIAQYLIGVQNSLEVELGHVSRSAQLPRRSGSVFIEPIKIKDGRLELCASVFSPADRNGGECIKYAEETAGYLKDDNCPVTVEDISIGEVEYNRACMGFVCRVTGIIDKSENKRYYFTAEEFEGAPGVTVSCGIAHYEIKRSFEQHPIMSIFSDRPIGYVDSENVCDITIPDVPALFIPQLADSGRFKLTIGKETFYDCVCIESRGSETRRSSVVVRGYMTERKTYEGAGVSHES